MARSVRDIFQSICAAGWRRRYAVCIPFALMPFVGLGASFLAPAVYESKMTVLVQEPARMNPFLNDLAIGTNVKERMPALTALLRSEHVLVRVLMDLGQIKEDTDPRTRGRLIGELGRAITVQLTGSELVELRVRARQGYGLGKKLEAISNRFIERLLSPERGAVASSESFLDEQLKRRRLDLEKAESALAEFRRWNSDKLPALYNANVQRLAVLTQKLEEKTMELSTADTLFEDLRQRLAGTNPVIGRLEESIVQATSELAALRARYTDEHSDVVAMDRRLTRLHEERQAILAASAQFGEMDIDRLWNMAASATTGADKNTNSVPLLISQMQRLQEAQARRTTLRQDAQQIEKLIHSMQDTIAEFGPIEQQQRRLERSVDVARELHDSIAKRGEMAKLTGALGRYETPERIKIIDAPSDPTSPVTPGRFLFVLGAAFAGLIMGGGLATALELLDSTVRRASVIASIANLPVVASISRIQPPDAPARQQKSGQSPAKPLLQAADSPLCQA
ncbi:MAG: putative polysaccharide export protein [Hyphomicrobiales bacterium]|nr:putative polysaccharide export protein [Hyphomicrobiales bacterium]